MPIPQEQIREGDDDDWSRLLLLSILFDVVAYVENLVLVEGYEAFLLLSYYKWVWEWVFG